jgi:tight adherence protein B
MLGVLWIIPLTVFVAAFCGIIAAHGLLFAGKNPRTLINRRLAESRRLTDARQAVDALRRERGVIDVANPWLRDFNDMLMQTGLKLDRKLLLLSVVAFTVLLFLLLALILGMGVTSGVLSVVLSLTLTYLFFRSVRARRISRFADQLPEAIDLIVRGVRVGYPLPAALGLVAREMPGPIGTEFELTSEEIAFGQDVKTAVDNLYRRVGQEDLLFLVVAINVQSQTGGNLAEVLARLSRLVRQRAKVQLKVKALTAEGRISAKFLSAMPFILFGVVSLVSPSYFGEVRNHPLLAPALIYAGISLVIGNIIMHRMVNFKF